MRTTSRCCSWLLLLIALILPISAKFVDFPLSAVSISDVDFKNERNGHGSKALAKLRYQAKPSTNPEFCKVIAGGISKIRKKYPRAQSRLNLLYIRQEGFNRKLVIMMGYHESRPIDSIPQWGDHVPERPFVVSVSAFTMESGDWIVNAPQFEVQPQTITDDTAYHRARSLTPIALQKILRHEIDVERAWAIAQLACWRRSIRLSYSVVITRPEPSFNRDLRKQVQFDFNVLITPKEPNQALSALGYTSPDEAWITVGMDGDLKHVAYSTRRPIHDPETES